jgi:putative transcription factor
MTESSKSVSRIPTIEKKFSTENPDWISGHFISMNDFVDRFQDHRVFRKTAPQNTGPRHAPAPKPDGRTRKLQSIESETESFEIQTTDITFANRLKNLRAEKNMTQKDLAMRASVKIEVIRDFENGKGIPDGRLIHRLEQILGGSLRKSSK